MSGPLEKGLSLVGAVASAVAIGFVCGCLWMHGHAATLAVKTENTAIKSVGKVEGKAADISLAVGQQTAGRVARIQTDTQEVIRYVPQIVTADVVQHYPLSNGFVRAVNAGITGDVQTLAEPAAEPDDAASKVDPADGAAVLAQDFGTCRQAIAGYEGWNEFARREGLIPLEEGR